MQKFDLEMVRVSHFVGLSGEFLSKFLCKMDDCVRIILATYNQNFLRNDDFLFSVSRLGLHLGIHLLKTFAKVRVSEFKFRVRMDITK